MSYAKSRQNEIETVVPYGNGAGSIHFRFVGDYKTFCGRACEGWTKTDADPASKLDSAYCCSRCRKNYLK